jgi:hypothetical protein
VIARATLQATVVTVLCAAAVVVIKHPTPHAATLLRWSATLAVAGMWLRVGGTAAVAAIRAHLYHVSFHERGLEIARGVLHRRKQFIWYYQLTEDPSYTRTPATYLTHTATLRLTYEDTHTTVRVLDLAGIGSPGEVEQLRGYLETRRLAERAAMRGPFT